MYDNLFEEFWCKSPSKTKMNQLITATVTVIFVREIRIKDVPSGGRGNLPVQQSGL